MRTGFTKEIGLVFAKICFSQQKKKLQQSERIFKATVF